MIKFDCYYYINEDDVVSVLMGEGSDEYPFNVKVRTRDGKEYGVSYKNEKERDAVARRIAEQVDKAKGANERVLESIYNKLYLMDDRLRRVDKRGLRIWQQLKALLGVEVEEK